MSERITADDVRQHITSLEEKIKNLKELKREHRENTVVLNAAISAFENSVKHMTKVLADIEGYSTIRKILDRKIKGQDCTEEESAELKGWIKNNTLCNENGQYELDDEIKELFPLEWGEAQEEMDPNNI